MHKVDVAVISETHLNSTVDDNRISLKGFHVLRKDRNFSAVNKSKGGGIAIYINEEIVHVMPNIQVPSELEVLWCILWPSKPDSIILAGIYLPPDAPASRRQLFIDHVVETVDYLRSSRPRSKTVILGDFNNALNTELLGRPLGIINVVKEPTRGSAVLDKILTDIESYDVPTISSALGTADHKTVLWRTSWKQQNCHNVRTVRPLKDSYIRQFGNWICAQDWKEIITTKNIDNATEELENKLWQAYEKFFPKITYKCKIDEPPWMTKHIKMIIKQRDRAQSRGQIARLKTLRKEVRTEINAAKGRWYKRRMACIAEDGGGSWYQQIAVLTNRKSKPWKLEIPKSEDTKADIINNFFANICTTYGPLEASQLPAYLPANTNLIDLQPWQVAYKLAHLRDGMAVPPGQLPVRLLKEFSVEMAIPLTHIYNRSVQEGYVPLVWRNATVTPVPKKSSPESPGDLRPISLTPTFCKVLEQFIVPLIVEDIRPEFDVHQYGNIKGASTAHYLIRLTHSLLTELDKPDKLFSMVMFDFKKGFDLVDHTTLITKMIQMGLTAQYTKWVCSFLLNRQQRVKMPDGSLSEWKQITCGAPQGTLIGPIAFLAMINDAARSTENRLKYVDDLTIYQSCPIDRVEDRNKLQDLATEICQWANTNKMVINTEKCQVMHFYTAKRPLVLPDITLNGKSIPISSTNKLLGVKISNSVTWQEHANDIIVRGSKALYMLHVMKRYNPPQEQLLKVYTTYIRPLLEYCAPVFHAGLTASQAQQIERVQKRALKIIYGYNYTYGDLLRNFGIESLADRRQQMCLHLGKQILKNPVHRMMLPPTRESISGRHTRNMKMLQPFCCSARLRKSAVPHMTTLLNTVKH